VFLCQQHVTVFEKSVETDVMPSLLFEQRYFVCTVYVPNNNCHRDLKTVRMNIKFHSCLMADCIIQKWLRGQWSWNLHNGEDRELYRQLVFRRLQTVSLCWNKQTNKRRNWEDTKCVDYISGDQKYLM